MRINGTCFVSGGFHNLSDLNFQHLAQQNLRVLEGFENIQYGCFIITGTHSIITSFG